MHQNHSNLSLNIPTATELVIGDEIEIAEMRNHISECMSQILALKHIMNVALS